MSYVPLNYEKINIAAGTFAPSQVKAYNNKTFAFWMRSLFQRACSVLEFSLIDDWEDDKKDLFYYCLFKYGYIACFDSSEYGKSFQPATLSGFDFYYRPTRAIITNPALKKSLDLKIGDECAILKLTPDYRGIWDILEYYAGRLSELDNAINMSIINNKFPFILFGRNKAAAEGLKKVIDKVNQGEPIVVVDQTLLNDKNDKESPFQFWDRNNLKSSYLTSDQLRDLQTVLNSFDCEIGIPTVPYQKAERMVESEADSKKIDAVARATVWLESLTRSFKSVNELLGTDMSVSLRFDYIEEYEAEEVPDNE